MYWESLMNRYMHLHRESIYLGNPIVNPSVLQNLDHVDPKRRVRKSRKSRQHYNFEFT